MLLDRIIMKTLLTIIFILTSNFVFSQIKLDSLMNELSNPKKYKLTAPVKYMTEDFQRFESTDKKELYDVYLDSTGKLSNYIELSVVYRTLDLQGRQLKTIGYNRDGTYYLWDFPPIKEMIYKKDTTIETNYNYKYMFSSRKTTITDKKDRIIEIIYQDKESNNYDRTINKYNDSLNELTITRYDNNNKLIKDKNGVVFIYQKLDSINKKEIVEQRFLDINNKLVDAKHEFNYTQTGCVFSIIYRKLENNEFVTDYYNSAREHVCTENDSNPGVFIYGN